MKAVLQDAKEDVWYNDPFYMGAPVEEYNKAKKIVKEHKVRKDG
jgi:hypothetical protein